MHAETAFGGMHEVLAIAQYGNNGNAQRVEETHQAAKALGVLSSAVGDHGELALIAIDLGDKQQVGDATRRSIDVHRGG